MTTPPYHPYHPYHPIIYVRGFAGTRSEIEETAADPYMGFIFREQILVEALPDKNAPTGWRVKYGFQDINPGKPGVAVDVRPILNAAQIIGLEFSIDIEQKTRPGLRGTLRIEARPWT